MSCQIPQKSLAHIWLAWSFFISSWCWRNSRTFQIFWIELEPFLHQLKSTAIPDQQAAHFCPVWLCHKKTPLLFLDSSRYEEPCFSDVVKTFWGVLAGIINIPCKSSVLLKLNKKQNQLNKQNPLANCKNKQNDWTLTGDWDRWCSIFLSTMTAFVKKSNKYLRQISLLNTKG